MRIDIDNYEVYAIDYLEGTLDEKGRKAFELFLLSRPDIAEEIALMEDFSMPAIPPDVYPDKASLRKKDRVVPILLSYKVVGIAAALISCVWIFTWLLSINQTPESASVITPTEVVEPTNTDHTSSGLLEETPIVSSPEKETVEVKNPIEERNAHKEESLSFASKETHTNNTGNTLIFAAPEKEVAQSQPIHENEIAMVETNDFSGPVTEDQSITNESEIYAEHIVATRPSLSPIGMLDREIKDLELSSGNDVSIAASDVRVISAEEKKKGGFFSRILKENPINFNLQGIAESIEPPGGSEIKDALLPTLITATN